MALPLTITFAQVSLLAGQYAFPTQLAPAGYTVSQFVLDLSAASYEDSLLILSASVQLSADGGFTWFSGGTFDFQGGGILGLEGQPGATIFQPTLNGLLARAALTLNRTTTIGGSVTLT
jgi:hypothetical protein